MKKNSLIYIFGTIIIITLSTLLFSQWRNNKNWNNFIKDYNKNILKTERKFIEKLPIYSDYITPKEIKLLRKYLFKKHFAVAQKVGIGPVKDILEMKKFIQNKKLVSIDLKDKNWYFYGVKKNLRYLTPKTLAGLQKITKRLEKNLKNSDISNKVKIALSSAIRPMRYQLKLRKSNANAVVKSTHSYGVSFDIFYDDYYISIKNNLATPNKKSTDKLFVTTGFILGHSLRRQLKGILAKTIIELQNEGVLYSTIEKRQRCFHLTIL